MTKILPIAITILRYGDEFLFLKRRNPPYENLWSLVGGKVAIGEHIPDAAVREVMEETGAEAISEYGLKGLVSERLVSPNGDLVGHFLIFVGDARVESYSKNHREGEIASFSISQIDDMKKEILPSDFEMFSRFVNATPDHISYHEAELIQDNGLYTLSYYRDVET